MAAASSDYDVSHQRPFNALSSMHVYAKFYCFTDASSSSSSCMTALLYRTGQKKVGLVIVAITLSSANVCCCWSYHLEQYT